MRPRVSGSTSRTITVLATAGLLAASLTACASDATDEGGASDDDGVTLTVYSGQHEEFAEVLVDAYTADHDTEIELRPGSDVELANQIVEEGENSQADVILTEEPGPIDMLAADGLLAPVDDATLELIEPGHNPDDGEWLAWAARSRSIAYNPELIDEADLPDSVLDLVDEEWAGTFAYAPSGAFVGTVTYMINTMGLEETRTWLEGVKANGEDLGKNAAVRDAVEAGQVSFGLVNHYYWFLKAEEVGAENMVSRQHYVGNEDVGGLVFPSGAGILAASEHEAAAQEFLRWLADPEGGQQVVAQDSPQYPLGTGVTSELDLEPMADLDPPPLEPGDFDDPEQAQELLVAVGII